MENLHAIVNITNSHKSVDNVDMVVIDLTNETAASCNWNQSINE